MKKLIKRLFVAMACVAVAFGFIISPVAAVAEGGTETPEISAETGEISTEEVSSEEVPETPENDEETEVNPTFEDILAAVQKEAERYGYGDEYAAAMEAIKTAATTKQVTISTLFSVGVVLAVIAYIIYSKIKDKSFKKDVKQLLSLLESQRDGTNALIDGTNENSKTGEDTNAKVAATNEEVGRLKKGLAYLTSAFMAFAEGVKFHEAKKTQVEMNCVKALKEVDGEVNANEDKAL